MLSSTLKYAVEERLNKRRARVDKRIERAKARHELTRLLMGPFF